MSFMMALNDFTGPSAWPLARIPYFIHSFIHLLAGSSLGIPFLLTLFFWCLQHWSGHHFVGVCMFLPSQHRYDHDFSIYWLWFCQCQVFSNLLWKSIPFCQVVFDYDLWHLFVDHRLESDLTPSAVRHSGAYDSVIVRTCGRDRDGVVLGLVRAAKCYLTSTKQCCLYCSIFKVSTIFSKERVSMNNFPF